MGISLRAGRLMGARDAAGARAAVRATLLLASGYGLCASAAVAAAHSAVVPVFTDPASEAGALVARFSFALCGVLVLDCLQSAAAGALRGAGSPATGALSSVVSYLCVGMPLSWVLAKTLGLGLLGIWLGVLASVACAFAIMGAALLRLDWDAQTAAVADLAESEARAARAGRPAAPGPGA